MADYPTFGLENWDDELQAYIDDADTAVAAGAQTAADNAEAAANAYTDAAVAGLDTPAWGSITGKPATFSPSAHTHPISEVTDLQTTLDAKAADAAVVKLTGNQTIAGTKTFSSAPSVPDGSFTTAKISGFSAALADIDNLPAGTRIGATWDGVATPVRPTTRTDITVVWDAPDTTLPIVSSPSTAGAYNGDIIEIS